MSNLNESVLRHNMNEGGSAPTESRPLDRLNPIDEGRGPVPIMPARTSEHTQPPVFADGCPECVYNVEPARSVTPLDRGNRAAYLCSDCGHAWTTDWKD